MGDSFDVFEEFLGMYSLNTTDADSIVSAITDVLLRFQIPYSTKISRDKKFAILQIHGCSRIKYSRFHTCMNN